MSMKKFNLLKWGFLSLFCALCNFAMGASGPTADVTIDEDAIKVSTTFTSEGAVNSTYFDCNGISSSSTYGTVTINEETYNYFVKLNSTGYITFKTKNANTTVTMVFSTYDFTEKTGSQVEILTSDESTVVTTLDVNDNLVTCELADAGQYYIKKTGSNQTEIYYVGLSDEAEELEEIVYEPVTVDDDIYCYFTDEGEPDMTPDDYFTFSDDCNYGVNSNNGSVVINSETIENCLKMEGSAQVSFTTSVDGAVLTLVFAERELTPKIYIQKDGGDKTELSSSSDNNVITYTCTEAGTYTLTNDGTYHIFYIGVSGDDTTGGGNGIINITSLDGTTEYSFSSDTKVYYSVTIPEDAGTGTLTIGCTDNNIVEYLYSDADCTTTATDEGSYSSSYPYTYYKYTNIAPGTYYGYINLSSEATGTLTATFEASEESNIIITLDETNSTIEDKSSIAAFEDEEGENQAKITVKAENLPEGGFLYFSIYNIDSENNEDVTMYSTDNNVTDNEDGTFTWTCGYAYDCLEGYTYEVRVTPMSSQHQGTALADEATTVLTVYGTKTSATNTTLTADPTSGSIITPNGESKTIELTFGSAVNITSAQISLGQSTYDNVTVSESETASTTWTLTITDTQLTNDVVVDEDGNKTMTIIIYATDDNGDVYDEESGLNYFELTYTVGESTGEVISWSNIQVEYVTNESEKAFVGEGITTDDSNIIVTFTDDVKTVVTDNTLDYYTYVTVGDDDTKYTVTAENNDDTEATSTSWTLTLSDEAMNAIATVLESNDVCALTLVVVAQDDNDYYVENSITSGSFPTYEGSVSDATISGTETPYTFDSDPFSGEVVESLSKFTITIDESEGDEAFIELADEDNLDAIKVYSTEDLDNAVTYVADFDPLEDEDTELKYGFTFTLNNTITDEGDYVIVIPEGFFMCGSVDNLSLETKVYVTVKQPVAYDLTVTPADGAEVDSIATITVVETSGQPIGWSLYESDITVVDEDGQVVASGINNSSYYEGNTETDNNGLEIGYTIAFDDTIRTAGKYTIIIPEGTFSYGEYGDEGSNEKIEITVEVSGVATGIKGVTLRATSDDKFYNISGQRVTSPRNGVFILNGKKILIK